MKILSLGLLSLAVLLFVNCKPDKKEEPIPTSLPIVITGDVSAITSSSASASGQVTSDGKLEVTERGIVLATTNDPEISDARVVSGSGTGTFAADLTGLTRATTYHVRAYATNAKGTAYGLDKIFITAAALPTVTTSDITNIASSAANGGGNITDDGGSPITARGVCWSTSQNPTIEDNKTTDAAGSGSFSSALTNLVPSTTYFARAYATSSAGTAYGSQIQFITQVYINPNPNLNANLTYGSVSDIDGNTYATIVIGTQTWMAENLEVSHYNNGDVIDNVTDVAEWAALTTGAYAYYNNDAVNNDIYGKLYNWYAATDVRGVCPTGWHLPNESDLTYLLNYLGSSANAGGKMKSTGTSLWISPNSGATNESGFSGIPSGWRRSVGSFVELGSRAPFWTSVDYSIDTGLDFVLDYSSTVLNVGSTSKKSAFAIRCLKD